MAENPIPYLRGVRTRYRNILETEIIVTRDLLQIDPEDVELSERKVSKCLNRLVSFSDKLEVQSASLAKAIGDTDTELLETIGNDDTILCSDALDYQLELKYYREKLLFKKDEGLIKTENFGESDNTTKQLIELQKNMQELLATQLQEGKSKREKENSSSVKLPKIEMITFNGDKTKWVEFWDSFQCSVHNNKTLSDVEKFNYLKTKLIGEARIAEAGLTLSNGNYKVAVDILEKRFGNPPRNY
ncbi:uncharacterized protein LOC128549495 [Mercenaria mercenaria]|uniref:uncharacterized protein LOC128549495 n=1 Tax=Mercenaria mercenaria TaxID=6596 RepID=UPI00234E97B2|nr:uncharacterized protein LOC128549495 [Mercenaria mercenaria]